MMNPKKSSPPTAIYPVDTIPLELPVPDETPLLEEESRLSSAAEDDSRAGLPNQSQPVDRCLPVEEATQAGFQLILAGLQTLADLWARTRTATLQAQERKSANLAGDEDRARAEHQRAVEQTADLHGRMRMVHLVAAGRGAQQLTFLLLMVGVVAMGFLNVPIFQRFLTADPRTALVYSLIAETFIVIVAHFGATALAQRIDGDATVRARAVLATCAVLLLGAAATGAITLGVVRSQLATDAGVAGTGSGITLLIALQLAAALIAVWHGWAQGHPQVARLRELREEVARMTKRLERIGKDRLALEEQADSLRLFDPYRTAQQCAAAASAYLVSAVLQARAVRTRLLAGNLASALIVAATPEPDLTVPPFTSPDEDPGSAPDPWLGLAGPWTLTI